MKTLQQWWVILLAVLLLISACGKTGGTPAGEAGSINTTLPELTAVPLSAGEKLNVVATTSIVADVVKQIGGDRIVLKTMIPVGSDPHSFEPTPQDIAAVADADIVFSNGLGLEAFLDKLIANAGNHVPVVPVSYGISALESTESEEDTHDEEEAHDHGDVDPHCWFDPANVMVWTKNIQSTLQALDPDNASMYEQHAAAYQNELEQLDAWIAQQVALIPEANRKLVTDHQAFSYFAKRYGFAQIGTVVPGYNASAQPSAQELANLERSITAEAVKAVFVGETVNPDMAQQVANDTGVQLVFLYTGSLSIPDGDAGSYMDFMRYNTNAIVAALK